VKTAEIIVVGAGVVGSAIAFGLAGKGHEVLVIDGESADFRASRANFGLIWTQSKGDGFPAYQDITHGSAANWADFAGRIREISRLPLTVEQKGGLVYCLGQGEWDATRARNNRLAGQQAGRQADTEMLDRAELDRLLPEVRLGEEVVGASFGLADGHANPLELLSCLHLAIARLGSSIRFQAPVLDLRPTGRGFEVETPKETFGCGRIVLAAGLSNTGLAAALGMNVPLEPQRGQILVTERLRPLLPLPASGLRQTGEGTVMIGATQEDVGFDTGTTTGAASRLASRATRIAPALKEATIVRQWSGLRILSPDRAPVYVQSAQYPGAFAASCHSGVTLAAFHAGAFADAISEGDLAKDFSAFAPERFDVQKCA